MWTLPFIAVLFAAFTTLTNLSLHKDIDYTKQEIKVLKKELDSLKELRHIVPQTKIYLDSLNEVKRDF